MTAALAIALAAPSRFAPFLATYAPAERAWMLRPATVTVGRLTWTIATDGASLYAEPGAQGYPVLRLNDVGNPASLEDILRRAGRPGVPMLAQDRATLHVYAAHPQTGGLVPFEGGVYDAARILAALEALYDARELAAAVTRAVVPMRGVVPVLPTDWREGRELMLWGDGRVVVVMSC